MPRQKILSTLDLLKVPYTLIEHPPVYTVSEAKKLCELDGFGCKNLFFYDKKANRYYLAVMLEDKKAHTNTIRKQIKSSSISFGSQEDLTRLLQTTPGSVSPLGILFDTNHEVTVLLDEDFPSCNKLLFHPNDNKATLSLTYEDFLLFLNHFNVPYQFVKVTKD